MENVRALLFARWMATCYSNETDIYGGVASTLNTSDGYWWRDKLNYFNNVVYPNYVKNGSVEDAYKFLIEE